MNVYDFDKTIYHGDSTLDFYWFTLKRHPQLLVYLPRQIGGLIAYKLGFGSKTQAKEKFYIFLNALENIEAEVDAFWQCHEQKIKKWYRVNREEKDVIISASPDFLLRPLCERLNVTLIASQVDPHTGKYDGLNCYGKEKVKRFKAVYGASAKIEKFYSDSQSDRPLALMASQSFLVKGETFRDMSLAYVHPYQEGLLYLFFGGLTFLISVLSYMLLAETMGLRPVLSNLLSWVLAVLFAFFTNKTWVFTQASTYEASTSMQFLKFSGARVLTLLIEEVMLWFFVEKMAWSNLGIKIIAQIIVISLNYVLSKVWIFEK